MEQFLGICTQCSDNVSQNELEMNNYGYFKALEKDIVTSRKEGRNDFQLIYVKNGRLVRDLKGKKQCFGEGTILVYFPKEEQSYRYCAGENTEYDWFHFSGTNASAIVRSLMGEEHTLTVGTSHAIARAIADFREFFIPNDEASRQFATGRFLVMIAELRRHLRCTDRQIEQVHSVLFHEKFDEGNNAKYASLCHMSEAQFLRRFKAYTATTPHKYKTKLMLRHATELLESTDLNISEIADTLGIADSLYFSRLFKKEYGVSPMAYRNRQQ